MNDNLNKKRIKLWTPVTYRIEVEGHLAESWSDCLAGMRITARKRADQTTVTTLFGRLKDQAELSGEEARGDQQGAKQKIHWSSFCLRLVARVSPCLRRALFERSRLRKMVDRWTSRRMCWFNALVHGLETAATIGMRKIFAQFAGGLVV